MCKKYEIKKRANTFHSTVYVNQHQSHQLMKRVNVRSAADQFRLKRLMLFALRVTKGHALHDCKCLDILAT